MLTKNVIAPFRAIQFSLLGPACLLFVLMFHQAHAIAQVEEEENLKFVNHLESNGWIVTDTILTYDPSTNVEKTNIVETNLVPELDASGKLVYYYAQVLPQFPGGKEAMSKFLKENLKYPELAKQNGVESTVYVFFVVDEHGNINRPIGEIIEDKQSESVLTLIQEAVRVVQAMPKWIPAKHKGKTVCCKARLPVEFTLANPAARK